MPSVLQCTAISSCNHWSNQTMVSQIVIGWGLLISRLVLGRHGYCDRRIHPMASIILLIQSISGTKSGFSCMTAASATQESHLQGSDVGHDYEDSGQPCHGDPLLALLAESSRRVEPILLMLAQLQALPGDNRGLKCSCTWKAIHAVSWYGQWLQIRCCSL